MIDLIFGAAFAGVFYGGFKCGNRFKTISDVIDAGIAKLKSVM